MDIAGIGERQAELFVNMGWINDVADLYSLTPEHFQESRATAPNGLPICCGPLKSRSSGPWNG